MKLRITMLLVLMISIAVMAAPLLERLPRPEDATYGEQVVELLKALVLLAFLTPFGWGGLIVIGYLLVTMIIKATKAVATTDYSKIAADDKKMIMKQELMTAYRTSARTLMEK